MNSLMTTEIDPIAAIGIGLTANEVEHAVSATDTELNLSCSNLACHIAINEYELIFLASN